MKVYSGFNADVLKRIAIAADNSQLKRDVEYASFLHHHNPQSIYCERIDDIAFIICQKQKQQMRIIGMGTAAQYKGKGLASILLKRCIENSRALGLQKVVTRSSSGADFYAKRGFDALGMRGNDYWLELTL